MRLRRRIILLLFVAAVGWTVFVVATPEPAFPVTVSVVNLAGMEDMKRVTMEFRRIYTAARFAEVHHLQIRVAGRWQSPLELPEVTGGCLLSRTNIQQLDFELPRQTEACRFSLGYRAGPRPYCRAYSFLSRHGISRKFPTASKTLLKWVPRQPKLRHVNCELEIPGGTQNHIAAAPMEVFMRVLKP
jgi:hypothetical protein